MSPEIHANDIREIADASSPEIDEKARKELLEMAGTRWKPGGSRDTKLARKKSVGATRGGGSEQSKLTCDLCDISGGGVEPESVEGEGLQADPRERGCRQSVKIFNILAEEEGEKGKVEEKKVQGKAKGVK
ncbi:hypothetical protein C8F04DRAFT_1190761 [Mycena alexandri]|uniref:Uncharacterized protein n=1 Tax=Mycena alexandri TaxID=1745969 RepID=A0AAD6SEJ8_9AGAR|nr:hypothetical protein C8F04DRAFT_1190761 [Mycena alexandri]